MAQTERGRLRGDPNPNIVYQDTSEFNTQPINSQVRRLCQLYTVSFAAAVTIAELAYASGAPR